MPPAPKRRTVLTAGAAALTAATTATTPTDAAAATGDLALPGTPLAHRALRLVNDTHEPYLRNHSLRGFLFGRAAAAQRGRRPGEDYDEELMFLICALHDAGLTAGAGTDQRFEVAGADLAARFLEDNGVTDARVDTLWDGIALHTTRGLTESPVHARRRPAEIGIARDGIGIDVTGGPGDLPPGYADRVHAAYPRLGGSRALTDAIEARSLAHPHTAPAFTLPGEILHQRHPELPYTTWDMILNASGWAD